MRSKTQGRLFSVQGTRLPQVKSTRLLIFCARHKVASGQKHKVAYFLCKAQGCLRSKSTRLLIFCARHKVASGQKHKLLIFCARHKVASGQKHKVAYFLCKAQGCLRSKAQGAYFLCKAQGCLRSQAQGCLISRSGTRLPQVTGTRLLDFQIRHKVA